MRPTSTKRENLCVIRVMLASLGLAVVAALLRRRRLLSGADALSFERTSRWRVLRERFRRPPSVAGGLAGLPGRTQLMQGRPRARYAHLQQQSLARALLVAGPPACRNCSRGLASHHSWLLQTLRFTPWLSSAAYSSNRRLVLTKIERQTEHFCSSRQRRRRLSDACAERLRRYFGMRPSVRVTY